jgi:hypothetical protein
MHPTGLMAFVCAAVLAAPHCAAGQEDSNLPARGQYALSFSVPEGGGAGIGIRKMISERTNAGIDVSVDWYWSDVDGPSSMPDEDPRSRLAIGVLPNLRLYRAHCVP